MRTTLFQLVEKAGLSERQKRVLELRYGTESHTLAECAAILRVTQERVRQIEARAIRAIMEIGIDLDAEA